MITKTAWYDGVASWPYRVREPRRTDGDPEADVDSFTHFAVANEARLRHALIAACGGEIGREAAAEALAYGWEHWDRLTGMGRSGLRPMGSYGISRGVHDQEEAKIQISEATYQLRPVDHHLSPSWGDP